MSWGYYKNTCSTQGISREKMLEIEKVCFINVFCPCSHDVLQMRGLLKCHHSFVTFLLSG